MKFGPYQNHDFITVGQEAILVLQLPEITKDVMLDYMQKFIDVHHLQRVVKKDLPATLKQHIPGLCGMDEIPYQILWVSDSKPKTFYHMPKDVIALYDDGWIDNGVFCDYVSRVPPVHFTEDLIWHIRQAWGDGDRIREIVQPYKDQGS